MTLVAFLQNPVRRNKRGESVRKERHHRWSATLNTSMPVALDAVGLMLLSGSAMMWHLIAGTAAAGVSCLVLNGRHFSRR